MVRNTQVAEDGSRPVMVPRNITPLMPVPPQRKQRLREHLITTLRDLRKAKHLERLAAPLRPEPAGFAALVARTACSLCRGWCCRNGDDDAFLDDRALARVRLAKPDVSDRVLLKLYLDRVPQLAYRDSCIFHGRQGCTLDRSLRADVCNTYYCGGLGAFMRSKDEHVSTIVLAGEVDSLRTSPVIRPQDAAVRPSASSRKASTR